MQRVEPPADLRGPGGLERARQAGLAQRDRRPRSIYVDTGRIIAASPPVPGRLLQSRPPMTDLPRAPAVAQRSLRHTPVSTTTAVLTLALGIGLSTAVFTVADALLLRPLPVRDQDRLVVLCWARSRSSAGRWRGRTTRPARRPPPSRGCFWAWPPWPRCCPPAPARGSTP